MTQQQLPESTYQSNNKLGIRNGVDFFMRSDTEQFAQFVLRVHQLQSINQSINNFLEWP